MSDIPASSEQQQSDTRQKVLELHDRLKKLQEPKGCFFNQDRKMTDDLLESLLVTKARYGYMACPCRMANGKLELDKDIICPCVYREPDLKEYGSCFCGLYVTQEWNEGATPHVYVPDRRPPEKIIF
jgi:ferredoxin-thioredoxin reductase catalytic subunit